MKHYPYLIVGGGMTAAAAIQGIRTVDTQGKIGLFSAEPHRPYKRPPLSKSLWTGKKTMEQVWFDDVQGRAVDFHLDCPVDRFDPQGKTVEDKAGQRYTYDKLLLATGGSPRRLPFDVPGLIYFRTLDDYQALRAAAQPKKHLAVIGGGFIGAEVAAALCLAGTQVSMIFPEDGLCQRIFPTGLSQHLNEVYRQKEVEVLAGEQIATVEKSGDTYRLGLKSGSERWVDGVVAGIGLQPNTHLPQAAGLAVEDGILVNETLQTSDPDVFAAGDVANFYAPTVARRMRVEHEDNALSMGRLSGQNMANSRMARALQAYHHLPYFYSDLFEDGYEAVGILDSRLETRADWQEPNRKGVIYYIENDQVRGVLLWNVWDQVAAARGVIGLPYKQAAEQMGTR